MALGSTKGKMLDGRHRRWLLLSINSVNRVRKSGVDGVVDQIASNLKTNSLVNAERARPIPYSPFDKPVNWYPYQEHP